MQDEPTRISNRRTENFDPPRPERKNPSGQPPGGLAALLGGAALVAYAVYKGTSRPHRDQRRQAEPPKQASSPSRIDASVNIAKPAAEIYQFWRNLENLPRFMKHLESVETRGNNRSHWVAKSPVGGAPVEWDAEIVEEREGELISWRSLPDSQVHNAGNVRFEPATGGRGTYVKVHMELVPPGGAAGRLAASLLEPVTTQEVKEDLRRLKNLLEAGEIPTTEGQPAGRRPLINLRNPL